MDAQVIAFYRRIYADFQIDSEEAKELTDFFSKLNAPPDKIVWMRSTAFRIASEFLKTDGDSVSNRDANLSLLKTINYMVHAIESICMEPKADLEKTGSPLDSNVVMEFYKRLYEDLTIDREENAELLDFFKTEPTRPDKNSLIKARFLAFKTAIDFLSDDDKAKNVQLLRCINSIVHAFEVSCLQPKPFHLKKDKNLVNLADMSLQEATQELWKLDANRLDPYRDYQINVQKGKKPYCKEDKADQPLFSYVDKRVFQRRTYATFIALLDNYIAHTGESEVVTRAEEKEMQDFLNAVMETKPMQFCHWYCCAKNDSIPKGREAFIKLLYKIWFQLYRRQTHNDSSGFEHVFVGEIKDGQVVIGFHNWIQFYLQEQKGTVDYRGYIKPRSRLDSESNENDHLLTLQFTWHGVEKSVGSSFIGVSPEFEFALYTMCFLVGEESNRFRLATGSVDNDTFDLEIICHKMARDKIGTCYPDIKAHWEE